MTALPADVARAPLIDMVQLSTLKDAGIPDLYEESEMMLKETLGVMQGVRAQAASTLTADVMDNLGCLAHKIKSGICMVGCARLAALCHLLEVFGKNGPQQNAASYFHLYDTFLFPLSEESLIALKYSLES